MVLPSSADILFLQDLFASFRMGGSHRKMGLSMDLTTGSSVVKTLCFQFRGGPVQSLVGELRSHMQCGTAKKKNKNKKPTTSSNNQVEKETRDCEAGIHDTGKLRNAGP